MMDQHPHTHTHRVWLGPSGWFHGFATLLKLPVKIQKFPVTPDPCCLLLPHPSGLPASNSPT